MIFLFLNLVSHLMCLSQAFPISYNNWKGFKYPQPYQASTRPTSPTRPPYRASTRPPSPPTARPPYWAYYQAAPSPRTAAPPQFRPQTQVRNQHLAHNSRPRFNPRPPTRPPTYPPTANRLTYPPAANRPTNPPNFYTSVPPPQVLNLPETKNFEIFGVLKRGEAKSVAPPFRQLTASTPNLSLNKTYLAFPFYSNTTRLGPEIKMFPNEQPTRIQPYSLVPVVTSPTISLMTSSSPTVSVVTFSSPSVSVVTSSSPTVSVVASTTDPVLKSSIVPLVLMSSGPDVIKSSQTVPSVGASKFRNTANDDQKQAKDKPNPCASSQCGPHANCSPFLETYMCSCTNGYSGAPPSIPCEPIDHCSQAVSPCGINTVCNSTRTGPVCQCIAGYFTMNTTVYSCMDVDECSFVLDLCGANSSCANTVGSFKCGCAKGFSRQLSGGECQENVMERPLVSKRWGDA